MTAPLPRPPVVLSIAGSDPSGGAGIQADLKTASALGAYGTCVMTALTSQSTTGVTDVHEVPVGTVRSQIATLVEDVRIDVVKIGMLSSAAIAETVHEALTSGPLASVPVVLKRGYTTQIPSELKALLAKQPQQPFALALYGGYEADVIRKVGKLVGKMTYGVSADKMETYFQRSFQARDDLPIGHYEYANALTYVYGDDEEQKVIEHLERAVAIKPISAMEALEVAHAQKLLTQYQQKLAKN